MDFAGDNNLANVTHIHCTNTSFSVHTIGTIGPSLWPCDTGENKQTQIGSWVCWCNAYSVKQLERPVGHIGERQDCGRPGGGVSTLGTSVVAAAQGPVGTLCVLPGPSL